LQLAPDIDLPSLAAACAGYSGADLAALAREAAMARFSSAAAQLVMGGEWTCACRQWSGHQRWLLKALAGFSAAAAAAAHLMMAHDG
jgi:SpoVK/Ycf46/Vps4 family AAA+-type ATPase